MEMHGPGLRAVDELLDQAGDAVARNDWGLAKKLAEAVLRQTRHHPEAELVLRTADAYLETERAPDDPLSSSRDLRFMSIMFCDVVGSTQAGARARRCAVAQHAGTVQASLRPGRSPVRRLHPRSQR